MPKKKVVSPPIPSDLLPVVDTLIRRAVPCLESFVPTPVCLEDAITEALHRYARDQGTGRMTAQEMRARTRPVPEVANIPSYVSYQLCQRLYRHVANASGKMLAVPELLGFADLAVEVVAPGAVTVQRTSPEWEPVAYDPELEEHLACVAAGVPSNYRFPGANEYAPAAMPAPVVTTKPDHDYDFEITVTPENRWWRFVVAPCGSGIASTFQRLQQLRAWATESDIKVSGSSYYLPNLGPAHFGVISDDEDLCLMAQDQGFRSLLILI